MKNQHELRALVKRARAKGIVVGGGVNGGGWCRFAVSLGFDGYPTKAEARSFARLKTDELIAYQAQKIETAKTSTTVKDSKVLKYAGNVASDEFLSSYEWRRVRMEALKKYGATCQCCGATRVHGFMIHVDHIKPRKLFPQLALDINNLQILCEVCNHGKGNWDVTDWRPAIEDDSASSHMRSIGSES
jgi:5-methylcytosine-specific restriction endonuclease McrA